MRMIRAMRSRLGRQEGFTLVELLVVAAILAVLASLLAPKAMGALDYAKKMAAVADAGNIHDAMERYLIDNEKYPNQTAITNYNSLRTTLGNYMSFPPDQSRANFTFVSYVYNPATPDTYTLKVKAKNRNGTLVTVTPDGVAY